MGQGDVLWLHWVHRAIFNAQGEPVEYQRVGRRITKRKRAEDELRDSRAFLRRVIDTVPNPIFVKDHKSRYVLVNKAMADLHGMAPGAMVGKDFGEFRPGHKEAHEIKEEDLALLRTGKPLFVPQKSVAVKKRRATPLRLHQAPPARETGDPGSSHGHHRTGAVRAAA